MTTETVKACCAGDYVMEKLESLGEGQVGTVRSVHAGLFNIVLNDGDLLTLQSCDRIRTPLSMIVGWDWAPYCNVAAGEPVFLHQLRAVLTCGNLEVAFSGAKVFHSNAVPVHRHDLKVPLAILARHFDENRSIKSVYQFMRADDDSWIKNGMERQYSFYLRRYTRKIVQGVNQRDIDGIVAAARKIIGLGPGMTPAGDDYLQGFFLFAQAAREIGDLIRQVGATFTAGPALETTELSRTLWKHFWQGRVSEPAVRMVEAFNDGDWAGFRCQVEALSLLGHSSGDDYLSGVWQALHFLGPPDSSVLEEKAPC